MMLIGGEGTRLRPLTYYTPKPMVPVLNRPFLEHVFAYLKHYGVDDIILTLNYLPQAVQDYFGDGSKLGVKLTYVVEDSPLGTAGAIKNVEKHLDSTFVVLNGDIFTDLDIADMLACHRRTRARASIALNWVDNPCAFGVVETGTDNRVGNFVEKPSPDRITSHWINAGIYILEPEVLQYAPAGTHYMFERGLFPQLIEMNEPVYGYPFRGYWLDMGTPAKYLGLNCDLLLSKVKTPLVSLGKDGICCERDAAIHPSARIVGPAVIGRGSRIERGAQIKGPVVVGPDCVVGEGASLDRVVLWPRVKVGAGASVVHCIVGSDIKDNSQVADRVVTPDHHGSIAQ
ncbi:MAG: NDP-sugar synthase [Chloroflexota bacterium]|nr:NDP-sugar synthase [Chloroflexota bacterium]